MSLPSTRQRGPAVAILTRAPIPGRAKTRLAAAVGDEAAARLAAAMLADTVAALRASRAWELVLFVEPAAAVPQIQALSGAHECRPQASGSVGGRMAAAVAELSSEGFAPLIVVGTDIPALGARHAYAALRTLDSADVVLGPATDGGYYLIGLHGPAPSLFSDEHVHWSTDGVLAETQALAAAAELRTSMLDQEADVDTADDLASLRERLNRDRQACGPRMRAVLSATRERRGPGEEEAR